MGEQVKIMLSELLRRICKAMGEDPNVSSRSFGEIMAMILFRREDDPRRRALQKVFDEAGVDAWTIAFWVGFCGRSRPEYYGHPITVQDLIEMFE